MKGMTLIVKQVTKLVVGFILLYSVYLILFGHLSPGGGFVGGVTLACGLILLVLAFGKDFFNEHIIGDYRIKIWDCLGALAFLAIALAGYTGGYFFSNISVAPQSDFTLLSAGSILFSNIAIGVKVGACLLGVFLALSIFSDHDESNLGANSL